MAQRVRATKLGREHYGKAVMLVRTLTHDGRVRTDWRTGTLIESIQLPHKGIVWLRLMDNNGIITRHTVKDTWSVTLAGQREMELRNVH